MVASNKTHSVLFVVRKPPGQNAQGDYFPAGQTIFSYQDFPTVPYN